MQTLTILGAAVAAACASSWLLVTVLVPTAPPPPAVLPGGDAESQLAEIREEQAELRRTVERLAHAVEGAGVRREVASITDEQVRRALESLLEQRGGGLDQLVSDAAATVEAPALDFDATLAQLTGDTLSYDQQQEVWAKVRDAGLMDRMVEAFEARAEQLANDPDAQVQLGSAYLQKLFTVADNEKAKWSMMADRAFDEALELDPKHWNARFSKAVSLSFWPAFLGRGPEAMKHFEVLIEQQETSGGSRPEHAQTYLFLGNMYEQQGKSERAREIWQRGYNAHPSSKELAAKVSK